MPIATFVASIPGRNSSATHEVIFLAAKVPPLGSKSFYIEATVSGSRSISSILVYHWNSTFLPDQDTDLEISNEVSSNITSVTHRSFKNESKILTNKQKLSLVLSEDTGLVSSVTVLFGNKRRKIPILQQFYWYNGNGENCSFTNKSASGVYFFNPENDDPFSMNTIGTRNVTVYKGINC